MTAAVVSNNKHDTKKQQQQQHAAIAKPTPELLTNMAKNHHQQQKNQQKQQFDFGTMGTPEDKIQYIVQTPYGRALTLRTRQDEKGDMKIMRELELLDWKQQSSSNNHHNNDRNNSNEDNAIMSSSRLANEAVTAAAAASNANANAKQRSTTGARQQPATLYSPIDFPSVDPVAGDDVMCLWGRGRVMEVRQTIVVVRISSWRLATRSTVVCYLAPSAVRVVRHKKLYEMSTEERIEYAATLKKQAGAAFANKDHRTALTTYVRAMEALRYLQHKSHTNNEFRADLVATMITCSNNAATCASQLKRWESVARFAGDALSLIEALEKKKGSRIHQVLQRDGYADSKLFGEFKVKSFLLRARSFFERHETIKAMDDLKVARDVIDVYTATTNTTTTTKASVKHLTSQGVEMRKLHHSCRERRKSERQKERKRALAMFGGGGGSQEEKKEVGSPPRSLSPSNPRGEEATPLKQQQQQQSWGTSKSLSSSGHDSVTASPKTQRNVSFSEEVMSYEIGNNAAVMTNGDRKNKNATTDEPAEEVAWYQDTDVLVGLALFSSMAIISAMAASHLLGVTSSRRS